MPYNVIIQNLATKVSFERLEQVIKQAHREEKVNIKNKETERP